MTAALTAAGISLSAGLASAHVGVSPATGTADATTELFFDVGHGCENADTLSITVDIPAGVTGVRGVPNAFGKVKVNRDATDTVVSVSWEKPVEELLERDNNFYKLGIRAKLPKTPFAPVYFPIHQVCQRADGTKIVADWVSTEPGEGESGPKPAAALLVLPARKPGWNKYTVPVAVDRLDVVFADAQIVWKGNAGYSVNPNTVEQIKATEGATALTALAAGDEIWVKY